MDIFADLSDKRKHKIMAKRGLAAYGTMKWFARKKGLSKEIKKLLLEALIRPTITYGADTIIRGKTSDLQILGLAERKIIMGLTGMSRRANGKHFRNKAIHEELGVESIEEVVQRRMEQGEERRATHRNEWLRERWEELGTSTMERKIVIGRRKEFQQRWRRIWKEAADSSDT